MQIPANQVPNTSISSFDERYFYELDTINFLGSGKQWFGEEFSSSPGRQTTRSYPTGLPPLAATSPVSIQANCVARSVGANSRFDVRVNGQQLLQLDIPPTTAVPTDPFARSASGTGTATIPSVSPIVQFDFTPGNINAQGWLDWFEIFGRRELSMSGTGQLLFRDWNSVGNGNIGQFTIRNGTNSQVWDISDPADPVQMTTALANNDLSFINDCSRLREYVSFRTDSLFRPEAEGKIENQNLHRPQIADLIIISHGPLISEANRIAALHFQKQNLRSVVVTADQVFNEFSSGHC